MPTRAHTHTHTHTHSYARTHTRCRRVEGGVRLAFHGQLKTSSGQVMCISCKGRPSRKSRKTEAAPPDLEAAPVIPCRALLIIPPGLDPGCQSPVQLQSRSLPVARQWRLGERGRQRQPPFQKGRGSLTPVLFVYRAARSPGSAGPVSMPALAQPELLRHKGRAAVEAVLLH